MPKGEMFVTKHLRNLHQLWLKRIRVENQIRHRWSLRTHDVGAPAPSGNAVAAILA
jgi:hypothetical protein